MIWTHEARKNNIPLNHEIFKVKSNKFAEELGYKDFNGSDGFVAKFIKNGLKFGLMVGETRKIDKLICEDGKNKLNKLTSRYNAEDTTEMS